MLLAANNPSMIQQALIDSPFWSLFVAPGLLAALALWITHVLFGDADENGNYKEAGARALSAFAVVALFMLTLCYIPSAIQAKGIIDSAPLATSAVAIISNIITLPSAFVVGSVFINLPQLVCRVEADTNN